jgi:hypothetical protein
VRVERSVPAIAGGARRLANFLAQILADAVMGHAAADFDAAARHIGKSVGIVRFGEDRLCQVLADLVGVDIEGGAEFDIAHVIAAQAHVHQTGNQLIRIGVLVKLHSLNQGRGAITDTNDGHSDFSVAHP